MVTTDTTETGVQYRSLRDQVYEALLKMIVQRQVLPGERLVVDDLAARFKVSNTPVQHALSRLAVEHLVKPAGRRGYRVTVPTAEELRHLYDMRLMCEGHAVQVGIERVTPAAIARLRQLAADYVRLKSCADPGEVFGGVLKDRELHRGVVELADNPMLLELYDRLSFHIQSSRLGLSSPDDLEARLLADDAQHAAIVDALEQGDAAAAREAIGEHINRLLARRTAQLLGQELS